MTFSLNESDPVTFINFHLLKAEILQKNILFECALLLRKIVTNQKMRKFFQNINQLCFRYMANAVFQEVVPDL